MNLENLKKLILKDQKELDEVSLAEHPDFPLTRKELDNMTTEMVVSFYRELQDGIRDSREREDADFDMVDNF